VTEASFDIVVMGASTGGLNALAKVLSALPSDFPAPIGVVQHLSPKYPSVLHEILGRRTTLTVKRAELGEQLRRSTVYIAPPDRHFEIDASSRAVLSAAPRENFARPAADRLFCSAANSHLSRTLAVVLTGAGTDGALGASHVKALGGRVLIQDPRTSEMPWMPRAAYKTGDYDFILPLEKIAPALVALVSVPGAADLFRVHRHIASS
jgi:two-component system chemotaxis response regulator CheB